MEYAAPKPEKRNAYEILCGNYAGKKQLGTLQRKLRDDIKMHLMLIYSEYVKWVNYLGMKS